MTTHQFTNPTRFFNTIGAHEPVLTVQPGDSLTVATLDARGLDAENRQVGPRPNPMTGPFFIDGAGPGDALGVTIDAIALARDSGWTRPGLAPNVVDPEFVPSLPTGDIVTWTIDRAAGRMTPVDGPAMLNAIAFPVDPMIGCFGVAPKYGQAISTATSGNHGGNMDWRGFRPGATVWFPVAEPGALFFLGDCHARQGDGEISGTGVETACTVTVTFALRKGWEIGWPRGEDAAGRFTAGNARPLDQALAHATTELARWLEEDGLDGVATGLLLGQAVRYEIGNVYNPAYTVICRLPREFDPMAPTGSGS